MRNWQLNYAKIGLSRCKGNKMAKSPKKPRALGRGLSALMADVDVNTNASESASDQTPQSSISIDLIFANPDQPRRTFDEAELQELASSIESHGVIQPLLLRTRKSKSGTYEIVAGERRWRAAQLAKLHSVPAVIKEFSDQEVLEVAIIENVQRADLNPIEEALGYDQLMTKFKHTQQDVSDAMGKSRSHIANLLRLLNLPEEVKSLVVDGRLSSGHARALLTSKDPLEGARDVIRKGLSVRQTEALVKASNKSGSTGKPKGLKHSKDADTKAIESELSAHLGMKVAIDYVSEAKGGQMTINFRTLEQLDDLLNALSN